MLDDTAYALRYKRTLLAQEGCLPPNMHTRPPHTCGKLQHSAQSAAHQYAGASYTSKLCALELALN